VRLIVIWRLIHEGRRAKREARQDETETDGGNRDEKVEGETKNTRLVVVLGQKNVLLLLLDWRMSYSKLPVLDVLVHTDRQWRQ
jgi:hypothetical protein